MGFVCIALLVFAIGSQFAHFQSPERTSNIQPNPGLLFYKAARRLFPDVMAKYSLEAVEASLLMTIFLLPSNARDLAYYYLSLSLKIAIGNDYHRSVTESNLSQEMLEIRHRLWWSIYSLERSISIKMGRPESIKEEDISAPMPQPLPQLDDSQINSNIQQQIANANLTRILNQVVQHVSSAFVSQDMQAADSTDGLKAELKRWRASLPPSLQLDELSPTEIGFRSVIHLHQNYHHAWIMMCRIPLLVLVRERLKRTFTDQEMEPAKDLRIESMAQSCSKAARKMIRLFEILRENEYLARFSFTDFHGCSIATIIILLHGILERDATYEATINFALESLRFMATDSETANLGVKFVEGFQSLADEAVEKMRAADGTESTEDPKNEPGGYESWLEWMASAAPQRQQAIPTDALGIDDALDQYLDPNIGYQSAAADLGDGTLQFNQAGDQVLGFNDDATFMSGMYNFDDSFILGFTGLDVLNIPMYDE